MFFVSLMAFNCTAKGQPRLLYTYSILLAISFIITISFSIAGYVYRGDLSESFHNSLETALNKYGHSGILTNDVDRLQQLMGCCAINNYTDYYGTSWANGSLVVPGEWMPWLSSANFDKTRLVNSFVLS